jgi:hypothetical protein
MLTLEVYVGGAFSSYTAGNHLAKETEPGHGGTSQESRTFSSKGRGPSVGAGCPNQAVGSTECHDSEVSLKSVDDGIELAPEQGLILLY